MSFITSLPNNIDILLDSVSPYYAYLIVCLHLLYGFVFVGVISAKSKFIEYVQSFIQLFICTFLLLKFHPFRKHELHKNDSNIIFGSAVFLILNIGFTHYLTAYVEKYVDKVYNETVSKWVDAK